MTPDDLQIAATAVFGSRWKSSFGRLVGLSYDQILRYARGATEIPRAIALAVLWMLDHPDAARSYSAKKGRTR